MGQENAHPSTWPKSGLLQIRINDAFSTSSPQLILPNSVLLLKYCDTVRVV